MRSYALVLGLATGLAAIGCADSGSKAKQDAQKAAEDVKAAGEHAVDAIKETAHEATEHVHDAAEGAKDAVDEAAAKGKEAVENAVEGTRKAFE